MKAPLTLWEEPLSDGVKAGFTEAGEDSLFNLALHAGGDQDRAVENRRLLCRELGLPFESYTCAEQVHGTTVVAVTDVMRGRGRLSQGDTIPASDALITNRPGIFLNIFVADCVPIILYDRRTRSGGLCHGGWRGTAGRIVMKTVEAMAKNYRTRPEDVRAFIGPSIGGCCYEVGDSLRQVFNKDFLYGETPFREDGEHTFLDLKKANKSQLIAAGIEEESVRISPLCTCCGEKPLFSYRKSGDAAGRFSAFIVL